MSVSTGVVGEMRVWGERGPETGISEGEKELLRSLLQEMGTLESDKIQDHMLLPYCCCHALPC